MVVLCKNWSIENKQCKFNYTPNTIMNPKDINPNCDGFSSAIVCAWFAANNNFFYAGRF